MMLGKETSQLVDLVTGGESELDEFETEADYVSHLEDTLRTAHVVARET